MHTTIGIPLNPGPFTIKEHVFITIMAGVGSLYAYTVSVAQFGKLCQGCSVCSNSYNLLQTSIIAVQNVFYNQRPPFACES
jgi:hypothetical protein